MSMDIDQIGIDEVLLLNLLMKVTGNITITAAT